MINMSNNQPIVFTYYTKSFFIVTSFNNRKILGFMREVSQSAFDLQSKLEKNLFTADLELLNSTKNVVFRKSLISDITYTTNKNFDFSCH